MMAAPLPPFDLPAADDGPLLCGRVLDGAGGGRAIGWDDGRRWTPAAPHEVLWLHLDRTHQAVPALLCEFDIAAPTCELLVSAATRPRALREQDAMVATLRAINHNPGEEPEDMVSLHLWSDGRRLLTLRHLPLQSPQEIAQAIDAGAGPTDAGALVTALVRSIIALMNTTVAEINEEIDQLELCDTDGDTDALLDRIATVRRATLGLKRHMAPQHVALETIAADAPPWFEKHDRREISESIDRLRRYLDDLDISKESALVLQDDIRARSVARAGRTNFLLTLVASIFLPLTFLTGLLGMNVAGIPGAERPDAFWLVVLLCVGILTVQLALFWKWKWL